MRSVTLRLFLSAFLVLILWLLCGCGGGSSSGPVAVAGTWLLSRASIAGAGSTSCPGGISAAGIELFSCSPQDTLILGSGGSYEFDQDASGSSVPYLTKTIGTYTVVGNQMTINAVKTQYEAVNGVETAIGTTNVTQTDTVSRGGATLTLTNSADLVLTLAAQ